MPVSEILKWLAVVLLVVLLLATLGWPGLAVIARLLAVAAWVSAAVMLIVGWQPLLSVFAGCFAAAALVAQIGPHRAARRSPSDDVVGAR